MEGATPSCRDDPRAGSAEDHAFGAARGRGVRLAHHAEGVEQPDEAGADRDDQRDLNAKPVLRRVDADDLILNVFGLADEQLIECPLLPRLSSRHRETPARDSQDRDE